MADSSLFDPSHSTRISFFGPSSGKESLNPDDPRFKEAAVTEVDPICAWTPAQRAESVAERPGDMDLGRDLLNIAAEPGGPARELFCRWPMGRQRYADDGG